MKIANNKRAIDFLVIIITTAVLLIIEGFGISNEVRKYELILLLLFYYLGQYSIKLASKLKQ